MFRILIGISLLCSHHWCQPAAVKKTRVQFWHLSFRPTIWENIFFYKFLGGVFSGNTRKKCAGVYKGILQRCILEVAIVASTVPTICLQCCFLMVYVPAICLWCCKLLSFGCRWVRFCVVIYLNTKIYLSTKIYFIGGWCGRGLTSTLCICIVLL